VLPLEMKTIAAIGLLLAASPELFAQGGTPPRPVVRSTSGQFVILDRRAAPAAALPVVLGDQRFFELEPAFLTISCERIKSALYRELGAPNEWRGKIQVTLWPVRNGNEDVAILVDRFGDGWKYQVNLPQRVERTLFVRTLVQVMLIELANRHAVEHSAEVPFWLVEGLTQQLFASREVELVLPAPAISFGGVNIGPTVIARRENDFFATARLALRNRPPLTIEELSWPNPVEQSGAAAEAFSGSAQLFVRELLRLPNGPAGLREMVNGLGGTYNWQTAFLHAFHEQFPNQLALEKWWALQAVYFVGRDHFQLWTVEESGIKLDELLRTPVAIRHSSGELPARADVALQAIIRECDPAQQTTILEGKIRELELTRRRVAPEFMAVTDDYRRVLANYLQQRRQGWLYANLWFYGTTQKQAVAEVIRQLDALDAKRVALRHRAGENLSAVPAPARRGVP
jgi:hypothetical protein